MAVTYPATDDARRRLAEELTDAGFVPTQEQHDFDLAKIKGSAGAMSDGSFNRNRASLRPVVLGPAGEVVGGHHRVVAAHLAGIDLAEVPGGRPQLQRVSQNFRPEYDWADVLPDGT